MTFPGLEFYKKCRNVRIKSSFVFSRILKKLYREVKKNKKKGIEVPYETTCRVMMLNGKTQWKEPHLSEKQVEKQTSLDIGEYYMKHCF